jgi:hypothetical protein
MIVFVGVEVRAELIQCPHCAEQTEEVAFKSVLFLGRRWDLECKCGEKFTVVLKPEELAI